MHNPVLPDSPAASGQENFFFICRIKIYAGKVYEY